MTRLDYSRRTGKKLNYRIQADEWGCFTVWLDDQLLLKGRDRLAAHGRHRAPSRLKEMGALAAARDAIESLRDMSED